MDRSPEAADRLEHIFIPSIGINVPFLFSKEDNMKKVATIMGSDSDLPVSGKLRDCSSADSGVPYEAHVFFGAPHTAEQAANSAPTRAVTASAQ